MILYITLLFLCTLHMVINSQYTFWFCMYIIVFSMFFFFFSDVVSGERH